jgi:predicted nucleotidyltransferase
MLFSNRKAYIWLITIILWYKMANEIIEILKLLIEHKNEKFSIRKIALLRKINYKSAYIALNQLEKEGIVNLEKQGNNTSCSFNGNFNNLVFKAEYERREKLFKNKDFLVTYNQLSELNFPFILLLFGSHAKGTATKSSDIDFLLISNDNEEKAIKTKLDLLPYDIHVTHVNYDSLIRMAKSVEFNVVNEAIKKNIILVGIEDYYRLLKNAR